MSDLFLNENFEVELDDRGDLKTTTGDERVKQSVAVHVTNAVFNSIGGVHNVEEQINKSVSRVVDEHPLLDTVHSVDVEVGDDGSTYETTIEFGRGVLTFDLAV